MEFEEIQKNLGNTMNPLFLEDQKQLFNRIKAIEEEIQPVFNFEGTYTVENNPAEWLVIQYFNKLNYVLVSMQNMVLLNDEFFSWLGLKYIYEFYIKLKYISSAEDDAVFNNRVGEYVSLGQKDNFKEKVKELEGEDKLLQKLKESHQTMYRTINSIAHPNVESLNLHKAAHTDEDRFYGLKLNMQFCMYLIYGLVEVASNDLRFKLVNKPDLEKLKSITGDIKHF
jgi:hypothetical protein